MFLLTLFVTLLETVQGQGYGPFYYPTGADTDPIFITFGEYNTTHFYVNMFIIGDHWFGFAFASGSGCTLSSTMCSMVNSDAIIFGNYGTLTALEFELGNHSVTRQTFIPETQAYSQYNTALGIYEYSASIRRPYDPSQYGFTNNYKITYPFAGNFCWLWAQGSKISISSSDPSTASHINKGHQCVNFGGITNDPTPTPSYTPTPRPSLTPTIKPSQHPSIIGDTAYPTGDPTKEPTNSPTKIPTYIPTASPTPGPTVQLGAPTKGPTRKPTPLPTSEPTKYPTKYPTVITVHPTIYPTEYPTKYPTKYPTMITVHPTIYPSKYPTKYPTEYPTIYPSKYPTKYPSMVTVHPTHYPTKYPTIQPIISPTFDPSVSPFQNSYEPSKSPTMKCPIGCLVFVMDNCNECMCNLDRGYDSCKLKDDCTKNIESYCKKCNNEEKPCINGQMAAKRVLNSNKCDFEECVDGQGNGKKMYYVCWNVILVVIAVIVLMI